MTISIVIDPNGDVTKENLVGYEPLSKAIGGLIESVPASPEITIWCNEEGKILNLDYNPVATAFWKVFDDYGCVTAGDVLVGTVVIQGPVDEEGETTDVDPAILGLLGLDE
jgi:hypothetical protein